MNEPILTVPDLAAWARQTIAPDDEYATLLINAVSVLINTEAFGADEAKWTWTRATAPSRIRDIAGVIGKRNWLNPTQITHEGSIGPIGGDTYIKEFAAGLTLTETERAEIRRLAGLPDESTSGAGVMHIMAMASGRGSRGEHIFVPDSSGSDWQIPFVDTNQDTFYRPVD